MRVMLDTNLWSSIGDEGVARSFDALMTARGFEVLVAPSMLLEVIGLPVPQARQRIITAMGTGRRRRLATEAQSESAEVVAEVRRARPAWMRSIPDTATVTSLNTFWTKRVWRQALRDSQRFHDFETRQRQRAMSNVLVQNQRDQRNRMLRTDFRIRPLTAIVATPSSDAPDWYLAGWSGDPVEMWRLECRDVYWRELAVVGGRAVLTREDATMADWIGAYVDLSRLRASRADFTRFWLYDVTLTAVPRNWVRWAARLAQTSVKITGGNPADEQHSSYLVDTDLFLSADARYVEILELVRSDAPFPIAESRLVSGDRTTPVLDRIAATI
jgi:hypothetical protein